MHAEKTRASRGVDGGRRTTATPSDASLIEPASPHSVGVVPPNPEVVAKPTRRHFTAADKLRILKLADACTEVGSLGALLRAEGLYASNLATWRRQRTEGTLSALTPQKRGRKGVAPHPLQVENETLRQENARLSTRLKQAELIIEVQKKSHRCWASRWRRPRKAGAADGRHTVPVHGDRHQARLCRLGHRTVGVLSWAAPGNGPHPTAQSPAHLVVRGAVHGAGDAAQ